MKKIFFIRHGATAGNLEKRYVGATDEGLSAEGIAALRSIAYPPAGRVFSSPLRRCVETAAILYPDAPVQAVADLRECDFGAFEYKNYAELSRDPRYQAWIDSGGEIPFPGGESKASFSARCRAAYAHCAEAFDAIPSDIAFVVHGGTIMAILEAYAEPKRNYYDWQVKLGCGFAMEYRGGKLLRLLKDMDAGLSGDWA